MKPRWKSFENQLAKAFSGKKTTGSGNRWYRPGDVLTSDHFLIEAKQTSKGSYSVSQKTWNKVANEALFAFRFPLLALQIQETNLIVLSLEDFLRLMEDKHDPGV